MKKSNVFILSAFVVLILSSCSTFRVAMMTSSNMNKLELGMSKAQVTEILGKDYTFAEKRIEDNKLIEVLSFRNYYKNEEFYMFVFKNDKLEKWYREFAPKEREKCN